MGPVVVSVGHVTHDRYGERLVPGGCAYFGARTQHALGARVRLVTTVGEDFACPEAWDGFEAVVRRAGRTTVFTNHYPQGGPRVQRIEAEAPAVDPSSLPAAWREASLLHLAPVMGEVDLAAWKGAVRARVVGISVQGWIKRAGPAQSVVQVPWDVDGAMLRGIDAACVGEEDLVGQGDLLDRLCRTVPIVAFTHGPVGCEIIERGRTRRVGIYPGAREVDPTGAGDTFAAAFLLGLAQGLSPTDAAQLGAAAASVVIEGEGGSTLGRVGEARERVAQLRGR
jgi:sugar/nucleoside kinase (ribokinase family)